MKNVEEKFFNRPIFRIRMQGVPPPKGYFVRYVSGVENNGIKTGCWLTQYLVDSDGYLNFDFESEADLHWETEAEATTVSETLRRMAEIETAVVKVGL